MKRLTKIIMVQWYLFEAEELPIYGNTAIVGANGAGKSSILDGVQVVLSGGNKNLLTLNKGSNEKSKRSIREYCLGIINDPNSEIRVASRDSANSYLVLCFADDESGDTYSAGVAIRSTKTDPKEDICGYFITRGRPLSVDDFTSEEKEGLLSLPWANVKDRLQRSFAWGQGELNGKVSLLLPNKGPGDFTRQFYTNMSAEPGLPMSSQTIVKALLSSIAFKPINDPTKFVRDNMLDPSDINIGELKEQLSFWQNLREKAEVTAKKIGQLGAIEKTCQHVEALQIAIILNQYVDLAARVEQCYEIISPAREEHDDLVEELQNLKERIGELNREWEDAKTELIEKQLTYKNLDVTQQLNNKLKEQSDLEKDRTGFDNELSSGRTACLRLEKIANSENLSHKTNQIVRLILEQVSPDWGLLDSQWLKNPQGFDDLIAQGVNGLSQELQSFKQLNSELWDKIVPLRNQNKELSEKIERLQKKQAPLGRNTLGVLDLLRKEKIKAEPLCDLIDVSDEAWRDTVEAILGKTREALIVDPIDARKAIRLYRYEGKQFRGSYVVNTTKTEELSGLCRKGSLAEVVVTDNPHARALIDLRLGNIMMVEKESELLAHKRAATADMMLTSGGLTTMMREVDPMLGRNVREKLKEKYKNQLENKSRDVDRLEDRLENISTVESTLLAFCDFFRDRPGCYVDLSTKIEQTSTQLAALGTEIGQLKKRDNSQLKMDIGNLEKKVQRLEDDRFKANGELDTKHETQMSLNSIISTQDAAASTYNQQMSEHLDAYPDFDTPAAIDRLEKLREKFIEEDQPYRAILNILKEEMDRKATQVKREEGKVLRDLQAYLSRYRPTSQSLDGTPPTFDTFPECYRFVTEERQFLEETTLADFKDRSEKALFEVEHIFRDKFIGRLGERLKEVHDTLRGLNVALKKLPFHEEYCQFRSKSAPELKSVYEYALAFEKETSSQTVGGLFDPADDPDSPFYEAIHFIKDALELDDVLANKLSDYRNYFVFDVDIYNIEGKRVGNLSHRLEKGSGGESQQPFYVAIGSSLSTAYMIKQRLDGKVYGGMNLAPFDEAFSKLDSSNANGCLEFMKLLNLQVLLAAPDEKGPHLASQVDTMIWIYRDGSEIDLEVQKLTTRAHELLKSDYPFERKVAEGE